MSRLWKSELQLDLRIGGCQAEMRGAGWKRRLIASASAAGTGAAAISAALSALRLVDDGALLPADARLTIADEYVCYALLDAQGSSHQALDDATQQFMSALGREDLVVQVSPLPGGTGWLAAALVETHLHAWADALADAGVRLQHLHPALVQDLSELAGHVREDDAVIALLRDQGATLVRLEGGVPAALAWEPFDVEDRGALDRRLRTFVHNTTPGPAQRMGHAGQDSGPVAIYLYTQARTLSHYGAGAEDEIVLGRPVRIPAEHSAFEEALARNNISDRLAPPRRAAPMQRGDGRAAHPSASTTDNHRAFIGIDKPAAEADAGRRSRGAANPGAAALAALAARLRLALDRSRARRLERRRIEAELDADNEVPRDFSPTGSVLPDEWQDTVRSAEEEREAQRQAAASPPDRDDASSDELDLLAELEAEQALELAFMREDEVPASAWQRHAAPVAAAAATPAADIERRRKPLPATLVWPAPALPELNDDIALPDSALARVRPAGGAPLDVDLPEVTDVADMAGDDLRQAAARAYGGVDRRRSYRA